MTTHRENVSLWFHQSEPDYYLFFLKAWIPFNAWYVAEFPALDKRQDHQLIRELQDGAVSKPRDIIENFLIHPGNGHAVKFRSYLAELHYCLDSTPIHHGGRRLSLKQLNLTENPDKYFSYKDEQEAVFKVEKTTSYFQAYIQEKGGKVLLDHKKPAYDLSELKKDDEYIRLTPKRQLKISALFEAINPKKLTSIISASNKKTEYIQLVSTHPCKMIADRKTIAKGCIKVLYALRCMLFHGEVAPNQANKAVYENAYYLLQLIIKELQ